MYYITQQEKLNPTKTIGDNCSRRRRRYFTWTCQSGMFNCSGAGQFDKKWSLQQKVSAIRLSRGLWGGSLNTFLARIAAFPVWIPPLCLNFCTTREIICTAEKQCEKNALLCRNQPRVIWHRMAVAASDLHFPLPNWNYDEKASRSGKSWEKVSRQRSHIVSSSFVENFGNNWKHQEFNIGKKKIKLIKF